MILSFVSASYGETEIIAHRGACTNAPENTISAFKLAFAQGADGIETDIQLTKDGKIVCIHDESTKHVAGKDLKVADSTYLQLKKLNVGSLFSSERIPALKEVFEIIPKNKKIYLDIKSGRKIVAPLAGLIKKSGLTSDQIVFISFDWKVVFECKKKISSVKALWLTGYKKDEKTGETIPEIEKILWLLKKIGADGLGSQAHPIVTIDFVNALKENDMFLNIWTVNDKKSGIKFKKSGVDSITTDRPAMLRQAIYSKK